MLPQRNVASLERKSTQRRSGTGASVRGAGRSSGSSNASGCRTMIKITRNPFFNFRTLVRHGVGGAVTAGRNAIALSTMAGREWSALDEQQKRPYRRLAHLSKMNGGPFFVRLEHLRTFLRYPECVHNNEYLARIRKPSSAKAAGGSGHRGPELPAAEPQPAPKTTVRLDGASPQPDVNFGGYDVASKACAN